MIYFSMPADFKIETLDRYAELHHRYANARISETYGQLTVDNPFGSGRMAESLPEVDWSALATYVEASRQRGMDFNYTLNPSCFSNYEFSRPGVTCIRSFLSRLKEVGVENLTVALPSFLDIITALEISFNIRVSTICQISTPNKAAAFKRMGAKMIVVDEEITRDFETLQAITKRFGPGVEIIVNSVCHKNCIYKMFHYNHESHCTRLHQVQESMDFYYYKCMAQKAADPAAMLRLNWIRPEDLHYYEAIGIHHFKVQGRHMAMAGDPVRTAEHYMQKTFEGNLLKLINLFTLPDYERYLDNKQLDGFLTRFFENPGFCRNDCDNCGYCRTVAERCSDPIRTARLNTLAQDIASRNLAGLMHRLGAHPSPGN